METQKIVNLINGSDNENSKLATKNWHVIDRESKGNYSHHDTIKLWTISIGSSLCDYSNAYNLVTGNIDVTRTIAAAGGNPVQRKQPLTAATQVAFKNCALFEKSSTKTDGTLFDEAKISPMYNIYQHLCTIWLNTLTIILILQEVYGTLKQMR